MKVFDEKTYHRLFSARTKIGRRFERIYLAYKVYKLLDSYGYRKAAEHRKQRHAFWNTLWLVHRGLTSIPHFHSSVAVQSLRNAFDAFEGSGAKEGRLAKRVMRQCRKAVWSAWRKARLSDPEKWTANNFFKLRYGNQKVLALAFPRVRAALRELGQ